MPPRRRTRGDRRPRPVDGRRCASSPRRSSSRSSGPAARSRRATRRFTVATGDGKIRQGYKLAETADELDAPRPGLRRRDSRSQKADIEELRQDGTLMPDGLAAAMSPPRAPRPGPLPARSRPARSGAAGRAAQRHSHTPAEFAVSTGPRSTPSNGRTGSTRSIATASMTSTPRRPSTSRSSRTVPALLAAVPRPRRRRSTATGATRTKTTWADGRWNQTDLGTLLCGVFRGAGVTVPKGVCVRLGDRGELSACFNPETLCYEAVWSGGFVKFSASAPRPAWTA